MVINCNDKMVAMNFDGDEDHNILLVESAIFFRTTAFLYLLSVMMMFEGIENDIFAALLFSY